MLLSPQTLVPLFLSLICIFAFQTAALPAPAASYHVLESLHHIPEGWSEDTATPRPEGSTPWRLRIHLTQQNRALFEEKVINVRNATLPQIPLLHLTVFMWRYEILDQELIGIILILPQISTPRNPEYGMHMSQTAIRAMLQPTAETIRKTTKWLSESGISTEKMSMDGDVLYVYTTLEGAENLLQAKYRSFKDEIRGVVKVRALEYSIPAGLEGHIDTIQPTTMFGRVKAMKSTLHGSRPAPSEGVSGGSPSDKASVDSDAVNPSCNSTITPTCLRALYGFANYTPPDVKGKTSLLGIGGFLEQWAQYDDTAAFLAKYDPADASANFSYALINGGYGTTSSHSSCFSQRMSWKPLSWHCFTHSL